ncbi:MAG: zinc-ribbon domain-containing protein [Candidatus Methanoperedens sp.]|nr:zinc-ribbon domain-containing protein [Candidatus Methanoperedens sp.]
MVKVVKKIGMHTLEADYSQLTGVAKIRLDGEKLLSKFLIRPFGRDHIEMVSVGRKMFSVKFGGWMSYSATIHEVHNPEEPETCEEINEPEFKPSALEEQREKAAMKGQKDKLGKINALLEKLDEKLAQGEITEARYKELCEQYRDEAERLKNQVTEQELMQEVGLKAGDMEGAGYHEKEPEKKVFESRKTKYCPNCSTPIDETAEFCPECGVRFSEPPLGRISTLPEKKSVALAVVLSIFIPGAGQMYCGKVARGVGILVLSILMFSMFGYTAGSNPNSSEPVIPFLLWILVYIWNIYDAYKLAEKINRGEA